MSDLYLHNTLTREKQRFTPINPEKVLIYTCGPTVYQYAHLGNLRAYIFADTLKRVLQYNRHSVYHVINITDVGHLTSDDDYGEDKMEISAMQHNKSVWEIAEHYTTAFQADLVKLNVLQPDVWCKATDHIPEMIKLIEMLEQKGFTYFIDDGVYFDTSKDPTYGRLAQRQDVRDISRSRIGQVPGKRNPRDFALWKFSPRSSKRQMEWNSPWGRGFPGWHIECSAMSTRYLGAPFDIHTGGIDHIPVHHTNEIAQSENAFGVRPWVHYWLHCEFLVFRKSRMAKSAGNILRLVDLEDSGLNPLSYRYMCLAAHYRSPLMFSDAAIASAATAWQRLVAHTCEVLRVPHSEKTDATIAYQQTFLAAINDDLNTPRALAVLWEVVRSKSLAKREKHTLIRDFDRVLGLGLESEAMRSPEADTRIEALIQERSEARAKGDFERADEIRQRLRDEGILLEDTKYGTRWRRVGEAGLEE